MILAIFCMTTSITCAVVGIVYAVKTDRLMRKMEDEMNEVCDLMDKAIKAS